MEIYFELGGVTMSNKRDGCYSCGDPAVVERRDRKWLCVECLVEWPRELERIDRCYEHRRNPFRVVMTRASYRARARVRAMRPQLDLVDPVVARP